MMNDAAHNIKPTPKYLTMFHTNKLYTDLLNALFECQKNNLITEPDTLPFNILGFSMNVLRRSSGRTFYKNIDYQTYLTETIIAFGCPEDQVRTTYLYAYSMMLRDLFNANETLLKIDFGLERFGELPNYQDIRSLLGLKFFVLANTFENALRDKDKLFKPEAGKTLAEQIKQFIKSELDKAIDPNQYLQL